MKLIVILTIILLPLICSAQYSSHFSEEIYNCQKQKDTIDNSPLLFKRIDKIKRARNFVLEEFLVGDLSKLDTLFLIENFNQDILEGQIWKSGMEPVRYIENFNLKKLIFSHENSFSTHLITLVNEWNIQCIKEVESNGVVTIPTNHCYITRIIFLDKKIYDLSCYYFKLNF